MDPLVERLVSLVARRSGTALSPQQRERLIVAISRRGGADLRAYADRVEAAAGAPELLELMSAITVHKTDLFRDEGQLDDLRRDVLARLAQSGAPLAIWSAGCATGEEVATLLVLLAEVGALARSTVLGTDLSQAAIDRAKQQRFSAESLRRVPADLRQKYFLPEPGGGAVLAQALSSRARFAVHNLMDAPYPQLPGRADFDVILCRNVLIYFEPEAARAVVGRLADRLAPEGTLVMSTTEPLLEKRVDLVTVAHGRTFFYVRPKSRAAAQRAVTTPAFPVPAAPPPSVPLQLPPRPSAPTPAQLPRVPRPPPLSPEEEGRHLFALALEWAAEGQPAEHTLGGLRKALFLAPKLVAARYLTALILERAGRASDAVAEYRRAAALLATPDRDLSHSFLNAERLSAAVQRALARLGAI